MSVLLKRGVHLDDLTPEEALSFPHAEICALRAELFPRAAAAIDDGEAIRIGDGAPISCGAALRAWRSRLETTTGVTHVRVWQTPGLDYLAALAVVRYGEDWRQWPGEWTLADVARAHAWERGDVPGAVSGRAIIGASGAAITRATLSAQEG
jgi:hypothetical protein